MPAKKTTIKSPITKRINPLRYLGSPIFKILVLLISAIGFIAILLRQLRLIFTPKIKLPQLSALLKPINLADQLLTQKLSKRLLSKPSKKKPTPKTTFHFPYFQTLTLLIVSGLVFSVYYYIFKNLPSTSLLATSPSRLTTQILDRNGRLLYKIYDDENRTPIKISDLPSYVPNAFLAIEDEDFYGHQGISLSGIVRAIYTNLTEGTTQGGSTITQQLVKNSLLDTQQTVTRKLKEMVLAVETELMYDKNTILEMYLNEVGFGGPIYGIQEASQQFFGINAKNLSLAQAAFLAGLPKAPSKYSPYIRPQISLARQKLVLMQMINNHFISQEAYEQALQEKLVFSSPQKDILAPHFVMYIRDLLVDQFGEDLVNRGGLKVTTTLDLDIQQTAQEAVKDEIKRIGSLKVTNGAALITRPSNGEILAMVGSKDYFDLGNDGQVNLTTSLRQPGSSIKPLTYALAFENGATPSESINDEPVTFRLIGSPAWSPKNYDNRFHGRISLRTALASSYNIPAVLLLAKYGISDFANLGKSLGISTWSDTTRYGLSMTLGSLEVKMTDMAVLYGTFANNGLTVPLNPIVKIEKTNGQTLSYNPCFPNTCQIKQTLKPITSFYLTSILTDNQARSAAFGSRSVLNLGKYTAAVKTGTSNDLRDNWTIGYTPDFVVATWVGNNDNTPMSRVASGITGASPIWNRITNSLLSTNPNNTPFTTPKDLVKVAICTLTNTLTCAGCPSRYEYFTPQNKPTKTCDPIAIQEILKAKEAKKTESLQGITTTR